MSVWKVIGERGQIGVGAESVKIREREMELQLRIVQ